MTSDFVELVPKELRIDADHVVEYITKRMAAYVRDYSKGKRGVLGLSGGVDSAVTAYLAVRALGPEHVYAYFLPSESTPQEDIEDTLAMIGSLKLPKSNFRTVHIDKYAHEVSMAISSKPIDKLALGNIKARIRMILLHGFAHLHSALVIGTGDKSELTIGYFTKFGDGGVDVLPLGDLYKSQVRQLAAHIGLPSGVYRKSPSPALWQGQSAEAELGIDYFVLDRILYHRFDLGWTEQLIASDLNLPLDKVNYVIDLVKKTQHKRYPPEIFRLSFRSHGSDWRYPREWA